MDKNKKVKKIKKEKKKRKTKKKGRKEHEMGRKLRNQDMHTKLNLGKLSLGTFEPQYGENELRVT